jgi:hypothetical protein
LSGKQVGTNQAGMAKIAMEMVFENKETLTAFDNSIPASHNSSPKSLLKDNCVRWFMRQEI